MTPPAGKRLWWLLGGGVLTCGLMLAATFGVVIAALGAGLTGCESTSPSAAAASVGPQPSAYALQSIPPARLGLYEQAGSRFDINWAFLASIGAQECANGTCAGVNASGCAGPMQIAYVRRSACSPGAGPTLWERYAVAADPGTAANVDDPADAIFTAARMLRESMGAPATDGSYAGYREAACRYYGACSDATVAYAAEVMARAVQYGFNGAGSPAPSSAPLAQPPAEEAPSQCAGSLTEGQASPSKVVRVAESQVGQGEDPEGSNCTIYGPCEEWCSMFIAWVWQHAGVALPGVPADYAYSGSLYEWVRAHGGRVLPATATPAAGDAVFYGQGPSASAHAGIIARVLPNGQILTVEGNYENHVTRVGPFTPDSPVGESAPIYGYAQPIVTARTSHTASPTTERKP